MSPTQPGSGRLRVGILGASGYGGAGLIERLSRHQGVSLVAIASRQYLGQRLEACWPQFAGALADLTFASEDDVIGACDVLFCATPHGATAPLVARALAAAVKVVDLSADFRLGVDDYRRWYGEHPHPELIDRAVYGLVELHRDELAGAELIASPGCNATAGSLALAPLAAAGLVSEAAVVNVITGVSGAGRSPSQALHFSEMNENARAYKPAGTHRHTGEIEATVGRARAYGKDLRTHGRFAPGMVSFTPHIVAMDRGILATCSVRTPDVGSDDALLQLVADYYAGDVLITVQEDLPQAKAVAGSDRALLSARYDARSGIAVVFCALDNLGKGAAGQAVQAFNVAYGFAEVESLNTFGLWP